MKQSWYAQQALRKRKALLLLPVVVIPIVVLTAWGTGVVGVEGGQVPSSGARAGINTNLPAAVPSKDSTWDKLSFYLQADKDSAKRRKLEQQDPYLNQQKRAGLNYQPYPDEALHAADEQERKVYEEIGNIHRAIAQKRAAHASRATGQPSISIERGDVDRLEELMKGMQYKDSADPELLQYAALMESIKDVQHPQRLAERLEKSNAPAKLFSVALDREAPDAQAISTNRFYGFEQARAAGDASVIRAVIHDEQQVGAGELVKMRLVQPVFVDAHQVEANDFVYGVASISGSRLHLHVPIISVEGKPIPVSLDVVGPDGLEGLPVYASRVTTAGDVAVQRSIQNLSLPMVSGSVGAHLAAAVVQGGRSLLKKSQRVVRYTIGAGYAVTLQQKSITK